MEDIRILIGDDDAGMRLVMRRLAEQAPGYTLVGEAADGDALIELFDRTHPEVVLLDVEMPGKNGIECGKAIQDRAPRTVIIFVTAHEEYMKNAFELYAFDYLVKPFPVERALNTLRLARERLMERHGMISAHPPRAEAPRRLMIRHREGVNLVNPEDILMVQREDRSTAILLRDGKKLLTSDPLGEVEERLPPELFFRSHRSYIINLEQIESIAPYGRWTHIVRLRGTQEDALITHERFEELEKRFSGGQ